MASRKILRRAKGILRGTEKSLTRIHRDALSVDAGAAAFPGFKFTGGVDATLTGVESEHNLTETDTCKFAGIGDSAMDCVMNGGAVAAHLPTITFMPQLFHHEGLDHFHESIGDGARKMDAIVADFLLAHAAFTVEPGD